MKENKLLASYKKFKVVSLSVIVISALIFLGVLIFHPAMGKRVFENPTLFTLCLITWFILIFVFICFLGDFIILKSISVEAHDLSKEVFLDNLTGIPNRHGLDAVLKSYDPKDGLPGLGCCMVTIKNLVEINMKKGHSAGNTLIKDFCSLFEEIGDDYGVVGRNGGNDFVLLMPKANEGAMELFIARINLRVKEYNNAHPDSPIEVACAYVLNSVEGCENYPHLMTATYNKLHSNRQ